MRTLKLSRFSVQINITLIPSPPQPETTAASLKNAIFFHGKNPSARVKYAFCYNSPE